MFRASAQVFGVGHGLLRLGAAEVGEVLAPVFAYWRGLGSRHVTGALHPAPCRGEARGGPVAVRGRACGARNCEPR
ncbi:MAG: hypothetical protein M3495_07720 [Pseudomonadota bacterium]|nr:hypothetical protein [Gammaproteobacteria bacterium]MDQ3581495.1 hypothetical protein [Pseudomonadota bacterium]